MILFDLFSMGFTGIHQLIISIFRINTIPEVWDEKPRKHI